MRCNPLAMGPLLAACALVATSCSTDDESVTEPGLAPSLSSTTTAVSAYDIVKVPSLTVDGNLNDWVNISGISMADHSGRSGGLDNTATVKLAWDDTYLYAAYAVTDTDLRAVQTTRDHDSLYTDDEVELYIDPQGDGVAAPKMTTTDYQFLANVLEAVGDNRGDGAGSKDSTYDAPSFLAKAITNGTLNADGTDTGYTLELRIAWTDLGVTPAAGNSMRIDPAVGDRDGNPPPGTEEFDWAGLGNFNNPSGWKEVHLVNRPTPASAYDLIKLPTALNIDGSLSDWAGVRAIFMADTSGRTGGLDNTAQVRLAWDNTYLYAAYEVTDTDLRAVQTDRDNGAIYKDDAIEFYIDPQGDGWTAPKMMPTDYQLVANIQDVVGDMKGNGTGGKDAGYYAASLFSKTVRNGTLNASGTDVGYTLELRISWADLGVSPLAGHFMRIDPAVDDRDGEPAPPQTQEFDWAGLSVFNDPTAWKDVQLIVDASAPVAPTNPDLTVVSSSQINVSWIASTSQDAAKYNIYRDASPTPTATVSGSPYHDTGLAPGTTHSYQISTVDAAGNESPKTAAKSATTSGGGSASTGLRAGLFNTMGIIGKGPGNDASGPIYGVATGVVTPTNVNSRIAEADSADVTLVLNLADSRKWWTDIGSDSRGDGCRQYNAAVYESQIRRFQGNDTLADALARRRAVVYLVDEPFHPTFCRDAPKLDPAAVNQMGLLVKSIWPGAITIVRASAKFMVTEGWNGSGAPPQGFWTGVDYGWAQFEGQHIPSNGETPVQFYAREKSQLASGNLGMIPGHNFLDGGLYTDFLPAAPACWDYANNGSSSGYVKGTFSGGLAPGDTIACGARPANETRFLSSPALLRAIVDATWNDPDAPFLAMWTHAQSDVASQQPFIPYEGRSDFVAALNYVVTKAGSRTTWNGWRTAK